MADPASFPVLYMLILLTREGLGLVFLATLARINLSFLSTDLYLEVFLGVVTRVFEEGKKEVSASPGAELMMPTLRDSTMSHPGENSHQVRVKAYYKG